MTKLLIRLFIKDSQNTQNNLVREAYGRLAGIVGVCCNIFLGGAKLLIGTLSGSIAIQADAVNNLSDVGSNLVTLIGFRMAGKPADKEHPFGHARIEYITALVISFLILLVGFELGKESVMKIIAPEPVSFNLVTMGILLLSILVKLWLGRFTASIGKAISSTAMSAATADSMCDVISTGAILLSAMASYFININLDGYVGVLVAGFVLYSGVGILRDTISIDGRGPYAGIDPFFERKPLGIRGDRRVARYHGAQLWPRPDHRQRPCGSKADSDIVAIHETIDRAEREVGEKLGYAFDHPPGPGRDR